METGSGSRPTDKHSKSRVQFIVEGSLRTGLVERCTKYKVKEVSSIMVGFHSLSKTPNKGQRENIRGTLVCGTDRTKRVQMGITDFVSAKSYLSTTHLSVRSCRLDSTFIT